jgi:hypothetical protein
MKTLLAAAFTVAVVSSAGALEPPANPLQHRTVITENGSDARTDRISYGGRVSCHPERTIYGNGWACDTAVDRVEDLPSYQAKGQIIKAWANQYGYGDKGTYTPYSPSHPQSCGYSCP